MARPKKKENEVKVGLTAMVIPDVEKEVDVLAKRLERSKSFIAGKLLMRGLQAFRKDGKFDEDEDVLTSVEKDESAEVKASANKPRFDAGPSKVPPPKPDAILIDDNFEFDGEPIEIIDENGRRIDKRTGNEIVMVSKENPPEPDAVLSIDEQGRPILVDVRTGKRIIGIDKQTGEPIFENK
jgi:hypothetical protein